MMKEMFNEESDQDMRPARAKEMLAHILSHEHQMQISYTRKKRGWVLKAAATVLIAAAAGTWLMFNANTIPQQTTSHEIKEDKLFAFTDQQTKYIRLPDGSTVMLNEGSELSYRESYGTRDREVTLTGEAYFDVKPDPQKPFLVRSGNVTTKVLGTAFDVKAYPQQEEIVVTVTRGKVQVLEDERALDVITPDQQIAVNTDTRQFTKANVNAAVAIGWTNNFLILDHVTLEEAATIIGDRYNVKIELANEKLKACRIMATFLDNESLEHVLTVMSTIKPYGIHSEG